MNSTDKKYGLVILLDALGRTRCKSKQQNNGINKSLDKGEQGGEHAIKRCVW